MKGKGPGDGQDEECITFQPASKSASQRDSSLPAGLFNLLPGKTK